MAVPITVNNQSTLFGATVVTQKTISADGAVYKSPTLAVAVTGVLTTRASATAGTLTMDSAGHGIATGNRMDAYTTGVGAAGYGATVGTVSGTSVPFTGLVGTLPAQASAMTLMVPQSEPFAIAATSTIQAAVVASDAAFAQVVFLDGAAAVALAKTVTPTTGYVCDIAGDATNPFAGNGALASAYFSHADTATARAVTAAALVN